MKSNKNVFTLIELIIFLIVLVILFLIGVPLVMNNVRRAKVSANKIASDSYRKPTVLAVAPYLLDNGKLQTSTNKLPIEYSKKATEISTPKLNEDSRIYLLEKSISGNNILGNNISEKSISENNINKTKENYSSNKERIHHHAKSSTEETYDYRIGDEVTYNGINYYVIKDVKSTDSSVTLLKAEPLTLDEVNTYGSGHINMYNTQSTQSKFLLYREACDIDGYGGMAYYTSANCGYGDDSNKTSDGCKNDYASSDVKYVVDRWASAKTKARDLKEARIIKQEEILNASEIETIETPSDSIYRISSDETWLYSNQYYYWTMSEVRDGSSLVQAIINSGYLGEYHVYYSCGVVRPVITIKKSAI